MAIVAAETATDSVRRILKHAGAEKSAFPTQPSLRGADTLLLSDAMLASLTSTWNRIEGGILCCEN
jgi:hypothetical protein